MIADDTDDHRSRSGYMSYDAVRIMQFGVNQFLVAWGYKTGDYPGDEFALDLIAVKSEIPGDQVRSAFDQELALQIKELIHEATPTFFASSLAVAMADGRLTFGPFGRLSSSLCSCIYQPLRESVANMGARDPRFLSAANLAPVVSQLVTYQRSAIPILVEGIEKVLTEYQVQASKV